MDKNELPGHSGIDAVSVQELLNILAKGDLKTEHGMLRWSSNYAFLVTVTLNSTTAMAVYKPQKGERPLWDFPDGTLCYRETAAFLTSQELGWNLVPPTVLREGPRGIGSLQYYIEHDPEVTYFSLDTSSADQLRYFAAFDYIVNNADRKGGHCLVDSKGHIWGIDHGIAFHSAPKLRTVIWDFAGHPIPDQILLDLERVCGLLDSPSTTYRTALAGLLAEYEITALQSRIRRLLLRREYPQPGPGPNYPWPPV